MSDEVARRLLEHVRGFRGEMLELLERLSCAESPTDRPETQAGVQAILREAFEGVGHEVTVRAGRRYGGTLLARPVGRDRSKPVQLMIGHCDTVWPVGTLERMPFHTEDGRLYGPGTFDMKAGLVLMVFALRALRDLGLEPPASPVAFINSDEEVGSPDSKRYVRMLSRVACRAFVPEPSLGPAGLLKTARKGVGTFRVDIKGKAAHAGLDPEGGASAIGELANVVRTLHALTDIPNGTTVNVGVVSGGTRTNVIAAEAHAEVDVRVLTADAGKRVAAQIRAIQAEIPGVTLDVSGDIRILPLERTTRNRRLWDAAKAAADSLGIELGETVSGGGSDGNTTSQYTATLDGLGAVGDGAHAIHEHIVVDATFDRCALLAMLLMSPVETDSGEA